MERQSFEHYLSVGNSIRRAKHSLLLKIEDLIRTRNVMELEKLGLGNYMDQFALTNRMFIALIAPSYTGKTQLPFSFPSIRPLYFVMIDPMDNYGGQRIYKNYYDFYRILNSCAQRDLMELGHADIKDITRFINAISTSKLTKSRSTFRSNTLGFIWALMEDGERLRAKDADWMRYYTVRTGWRSNIRVSPLTIDAFNEFILTLDNDYFVFLDEFHEGGWCVYIRNLLRCTSLMCVVASTNSKISNLAGTASVQSSASRSEGIRIIWAAIITKLPPAVHDLITEAYQIKEICKQIVKRTIPRDKPAMCIFLNYLSTDQVQNLRPGIAEMLFSRLSEFCEEYKIIEQIVNENVIRKKAKISLNEAMTFLFKDISVFIANHKSRIRLNASGRAANISLLLSNSFCESAPSSDSDPHRNANFINDHLYYLVNPVKSDEWAFLVYLDEDFFNDRVLLVIKEQCRIPFEIFSYLKESEFILTLSCMFIKMRHSTSFIMQEIIRNSKSAEASKYPNPTASGNCCLIELIDSTHSSGIDSVVDDIDFDFKYGGRSVCGVRGDVLIMNILSNLLTYENEYSRAAILNIQFNGNSERAMKSIHVPFLMSANMKIPDGFKNCLSSFKALTGKCLKTQLYPFIETCSRTPNSYQIDAEFSALFYSDPIAINTGHVQFGKKATMGRVVVDHRDSLIISEYLKIILKSQSFCEGCKIANSQKRCNNCSNSKVACSDCIVELVLSFPLSNCTACQALESSSSKCKFHLLFCSSIAKSKNTVAASKKPKLMTPSLSKRNRQNLFNLSDDPNLLYNFFIIQINPETRQFNVDPLMDNLVMHEHALVTFIVFEMLSIDEKMPIN